MTASGAEVRGWRDGAKREKDSWTWTTVWGLLLEGSIRGLNDNGKNTRKIKFFKKERNTTSLLGSSHHYCFQMYF